MNWWDSFFGGLASLGTWFSAQFSNTRVMLGFGLVVWMAFEIWMLLRASASDAKDFELTDCLKDPVTGKVAMRNVVQIMYAQVFLWSYVLVILDEHDLTKLKLTLMLAVLIVSLGVDIAVRVIEWVGKVWTLRAGQPIPAAAPAVSAPGANVRVEMPQS